LHPTSAAASDQTLRAAQGDLPARAAIGAVARGSVQAQARIATAGARPLRKRGFGSTIIVKIVGSTFAQEIGKYIRLAALDFNPAKRSILGDGGNVIPRTDRQSLP
jgi:hypothetical protein